MDKNERIARILLGSVISMLDGITYLDFTLEQIHRMLLITYAKAITELELDCSEPQLDRLKEEAFVFIGGVMSND